MARQWTNEQRQAITARGGDLLVSASAGSGKTAVLTERVIALITDEAAPLDIDRLLVVTFTKAAAAEMRARISERLSELAELCPQDARLARQQLLLDSAEISTIHSFCTTLIRNDFAALGLPADLRVADDREMAVLRARVMDDLLAQGYAGQRPEFLSLVELLTVSGREDALAGIVGKLYEFVRNQAFYRQKLAQMAQDYAAEIPFDQTQWCAVLLTYAGEALDYALHLTEASLAMAQGDPALEKAYGDVLTEDMEQLSVCRAAMKDGWDKAAHMVSTVSFSALSACRSPLPEREIIKKYRTAVKNTVKKLKDRIFLMDSDAHAEAMAQVAPAARELFALVERFDEMLAAEKLERAVMDFGDLEHYTLALLYDTDGGEAAPSARCADIAARFDAVLLDEYQDVSEIQEMLFRALQVDGTPLFMVGDVKQSVYRFREARPDIFLQKKRDFAAYDEKTPVFPARISLGANFRTRAEITGFINSLFAAVMSAEVGGMDYTGEDALLAQANYDYTTEIPVELCVIDHKKTQEQSAPEAAFVAAEIRKLLDNGYPVKDGDASRPVRPGDICILLRSGTHAADYLEALEAVGISCWLDKQTDIFQSREAAGVIAFLKLLVNPMLDLELAAVLASPMYSLCSEELAQLRLAGGRQRLFLSLDAAAKTIPGCGRFLEDYRRLRFLSAAAPVGEVVRAVCAVTGLSCKARAVSPEAEANLHLLSEYAAAYEARGDSSLSGFVNYLYALEEYGYGLPSVSETQRGAVVVMSIHHSKGLEFPVVFLSNCAAQFPFLTMESRDTTLLNPALGFGCVTQDMTQMRRQKTLPYLAIQIENARSSLSEELCILYVAMTRAREKLYLTAYDPGLKTLAAAVDVPFAGGHIDVMASRQAKCLYDWIAPAAVRRMDFDSDYLPRPAEPIAAQGAMRLRIVGETENAAAETVSVQQPEPQADTAALAALRAAVGYEYPYLGDIVTPEKVAVSDLAEKAQHSQYAFARRPKFLTDKKLTPAERGVAAHKFMQFADFAAAASDPERELRRLLDGGFLERAEAACVELETVRAFFSSPLGKRVLGADRVYREIRFIRECTPQELRAVDESLAVRAATVVQGVADCVIIEDGRGTVIDYKTDILKEPEAFAARYRAQLALYRYILRDTLALPVEEMRIYSFYLGREIPL